MTSVEVPARSRPVQSARFDALDGWRGIFALLVAIYHVRLAFAGYDFFLFRNAFVCVDFFFVLSGFVLMHSYGSRLSSVPERISFVIRRWGRLWPLHMATLGGVVLLELVKLILANGGSVTQSPPFTGDNSLEMLVANIFLVQGLGFTGETSWNYPSWSISCEFFAYVLFMGLIALFPSRKGLAMAAAALSGLLVLAVFAGTLGVVVTFGFARAAYGFFLGTVAYLAWSRFVSGREITGVHANVMEIGLIALILLFVALFPRGLPSLAMPVFFAVAVIGFATSRGLVSRVLTTRPLQRLGAWSYSVYLLHAVILAWIYAILQFGSNTLGLSAISRGRYAADSGVEHQLYLIFGSVPATTGAVLLFLAALLGLASLTHRFIELPGQALFAHFARGAVNSRRQPSGTISSDCLKP